MSDPLLALAERIMGKAGQRNLTLATAESCTAGCLATLLADAPDAGDRFHGGFVVYTKANKVVTLGVAPELIRAHSAVSRPVAEAMATGALERCPADMVIAITGVAGPEPDEDGNPVGLVHIAIAARGAEIRHQVHRFGRLTRAGVRRRAMQSALEMTDTILAKA
jgi:nicotinamide-nucleotide amidase